MTARRWRLGLSLRAVVNLRRALWAVAAVRLGGYDRRGAEFLVDYEGRRAHRNRVIDHPVGHLSGKCGMLTVINTARMAFSRVSPRAAPPAARRASPGRPAALAAATGRRATPACAAAPRDRASPHRSAAPSTARTRAAPRRGVRAPPPASEARHATSATPPP